MGSRNRWVLEIEGALEEFGMLSVDTGNMVDQLVDFHRIDQESNQEPLRCLDWRASRIEGGVWNSGCIKCCRDVPQGMTIPEGSGSRRTWLNAGAPACCPPRFATAFFAADTRLVDRRSLFN